MVTKSGYVFLDVMGLNELVTLSKAKKPLDKFKTKEEAVEALEIADGYFIAIDTKSEEYHDTLEGKYFMLVEVFTRTQTP